MAKAVVKKPKAAKAPKIEEVGALAETTTPQNSWVYPTLEVSVRAATGKKGESPITVEQAKLLLGWETEEEYATRLKQLDNTVQEAACKFGEDYLFKDSTGQKVRCWNNSRNRPFAEQWSRQLAQDILSRNWAGPTTMPGETINGETIVIGRSGQVESGQHRLIGLVLASQEWHANRMKYEDLWPEEPVLESLLVVGVSENSRVLRTLDNVKPRSLSDVFYTSPLFEGLGNKERQECSRMLQAAMGLLWGRTGISAVSYQTHSEATGFVERHPTLLRAVKHIYEENRERALSIMRLSPGQCAAALFLMGSCGTDGDAYRSTDPRSEKHMDWAYWERACDFFVELSKGTEDAKVIREALGNLVDAETGTGGRAIERISILSKAWDIFRDGGSVDPASVELQYDMGEDGVKRLVEFPNFGGIDLGPVQAQESGSSTVEEAPPTPEELEERKRQIREARQAEVTEKLKEAQRRRAAGAK